MRAGLPRARRAAAGHAAGERDALAHMAPDSSLAGRTFHRALTSRREGLVARGVARATEGLDQAIVVEGGKDAGSRAILELVESLA